MSLFKILFETVEQFSGKTKNIFFVEAVWCWMNIHIVMNILCSCVKLAKCGIDWLLFHSDEWLVDRVLSEQKYRKVIIV